MCISGYALSPLVERHIRNVHGIICADLDTRRKYFARMDGSVHKGKYKYIHCVVMRLYSDVLTGEGCCGKNVAFGQSESGNR